MKLPSPYDPCGILEDPNVSVNIAVAIVRVKRLSIKLTDLVRERAIHTETPPLVGEVSAIFSG
jgi:hypothetical protein